MSKWHGGKGSDRRKGTNDAKYRDNWDKIFGETMQMPAEQGITPNSWVIIEVNHEGKQFQKILSGWSGGYLDGDTWRLSSPIKRMKINIEEDYFTVDTESGSFYTLYKDRQGLRMSNAGIYNQFKEKFGDNVEIIQL